eukprot:RCo053040
MSLPTQTLALLLLCCGLVVVAEQLPATAGSSAVAVSIRERMGNGSVDTSVSFQPEPLTRRRSMGAAVDAGSVGADVFKSCLSTGLGLAFKVVLKIVAKQGLLPWWIPVEREDITNVELLEKITVLLQSLQVGIEWSILSNTLSQVQARTTSRFNRLTDLTDLRSRSRCRWPLPWTP